MRTALAIGLAAAFLAGCTSFPEIRPIGELGGRHDPYRADYAAGKAYFAAGQYALAATKFEAALARVPDSVEALNAIGAAYDELQRPDIALGYYSRAMAMAPDNAGTLNNIAMSALLVGDMATAQDFLFRAAALAPQNETILDNLLLALDASTARDRPRQAPAFTMAANDGRPRLEQTGRSELTLLVSHRADGSI